MKRFLCLLLIACMCCCGFVGCELEDTKNETPEERAYECVRAELVTIPFRYTLNGSKIVYRDSTLGRISSTENNNFKITGTVTVSDDYGYLWVANYDALVTYDPAADDYNATYELGTFSRK